MKKEKILVKIILLSLLSTTIYAGKNELGKTVNNKSKTLHVKKRTYYSMSTSELQKEMERLSNLGKVDLDLGRELIERWTKKG